MSERVSKRYGDDLRQCGKRGQTATASATHKVIETIILGFVKKAGIAGDDTVYGGERGDARQ